MTCAAVKAVLVSRCAMMWPAWLRRFGQAAKERRYLW